MSAVFIPENYISKKEVVQQVIARFPDLMLDEKTVINWAQKGNECELIKHANNRIYFDKEKLDAWYKRIENSSVILNKEDYIKCLSFAVEAFYTMTASHFNRSTQRDAGEVLTNQVEGKLGEIAVAKLLEKQQLQIKLDFDVRGEIPSQDIAQISTRHGVWNNPAIKVSIKSTKLKNILLAVSEMESSLVDRKSDIYILSQVGLFANHILRFIKELDNRVIVNFNNFVPDFEDIPARIGGWVTHKELTSSQLYLGEEINNKFGVRMETPNYIFRTGELSTDWKKLKENIIGS